MDILNRIKTANEKYNLFGQGDCVTVALSGGADSVCLFLALLGLSEALKLKVRALHINHCLRGDESDRDENFCRKLCEGRTEFFFERHDVGKISRETGAGIEETARNVRYSAFARHTADGGRLATAHTADDNAETVIHNLTRGTGLTGLLGIPPVRDRGNIIRPLIFAERSEVEAFLRLRGQDYVTDSTNLDDCFTRNKIRHKVMPALLDINPNLLTRFTENISALATENSFIDEQAEIAFGKCFSPHSSETALILNGLNCYHKALRSRCIIKLLNMAGLPYGFDRVEQIDRVLMNGGKINIAKDVYITAELGKLVLIRGM